MTDLRERVFAAVWAQPSPPRAVAVRRRAAVLAFAGALGVAAWMSAGGVRPTGRPAGLMAATFGGALAVTAIALVGALRRPSMLGRSAPALVAIAVATPVVLLAWKAGVSALFPGMTVPWPDRVGLRCLGVALSSGIAPLAAFLYTRRYTQPAHPRLTGLAIGTAAGAFTWLLVDLWCPVAYFHHLLLGHLLPVGLFAALGAASGRVLAAKRR